LKGESEHRGRVGAGSLTYATLFRKTVYSETTQLAT
jgi:hypothetical protein